MLLACHDHAFNLRIHCQSASPYFRVIQMLLEGISLLNAGVDTPLFHINADLDVRYYMMCSVYIKCSWFVASTFVKCITPFSGYHRQQIIAIM